MQRLRMDTIRNGNGNRKDDVESQRLKGVSFLTQTKLLFVKNWLSKKRTEPKKLLGEILLPVVYLFLLSFLVRLDERKTFPEVTTIETPQNVLSSLQGTHTIHVVHQSSTYAERITKNMGFVLDRDSGSTISASDSLKFNFYPNVASLMEAYNTKTSTIDAAIILPDEVSTLKYTIRINPDRNRIPLPSSKKVGLETCRSKVEVGLENSATCPVNGYYESNFLALQYLVDQALIIDTVNDPKLVTPIPMRIQNYPKSKYTAGMSTFLRVIIPIYCIIPLAQLINTLLILIVTEKEDKIKDGLKMIGVSDASYWLSWFGIYGLMTTVSAVLFTLVLHYMNVLSNISVVVLFLLFLFFGLSIITFAFALTPFFHKPKTAGAVGTLIMQFTGMLFLLQTFLNDSSSGVLIPLKLISSLAFTAAIDNACEYEYQGGIALADLWPERKGAGILYSLIFLVGDTVLYGLFALYLDNVLPNEFGVRKHPLFCFKPSYWLGSSISSGETESMSGIDSIGETENDTIEKVHSSLNGKEAIRILNMKKTYGSWPSTQIVEAVKGISLNIYEGQITAILGRNGAGKSTLLNMMTGLVAPTSGRCVVFGMDITDPYEMDRLRRMTGVCMQQDLHFKALTVQEHLEFYGRMRGITQLELKEEINVLLEELQLTHQRNVVSSKLSGGQKRKLSVGIALIGSPQIILLDEPSAGVDPVSRRHLWSLLQKKKEGRIILLTTHFMDEADILADRKAIVHNGQLKCVGSSLFLKKRFGVGYYLSVELDESSSTGKESDALVKKWIPDAISSKKMIAGEVKYALPHSEIQKFPELFADFENEIGSGTSPVKSYGVSMTTLEEVFLKISNDTDLDILAHKHILETMPHRRMSQVSITSVNGHETTPIPDNQLNTTVEDQNLIPNIGEIRPNLASVFWAISLLRIRRLIRSPQSLFFLIFMPVILVAIGFGLVKTQNVKEDELAFSVSKYSNIYTTSDLNVAISADVEPEIELFLKNSGLRTKSYSGKFADLLRTNPGIGTMAAVNIESTIATLSMNGTYLHVPGIMLNILSQYTLSTALKGKDVKDITTINQPFPSKNQKIFDQTNFYAVFLVSPAFSFAAVGMVMEMVRDREIKARNHLRVNGLSFFMYFSSIFVVFAILSLFVTIMEIIVVYAFNVPAFMNPYAMTVVVTLLVLFIAPCLLFSAVFSYFFDRMESAQSIFSQICSWMGTIVGITIIMVDAYAKDSSSITPILHTIFCAVDVFYIPFGIFYWTNKQYLLCTIEDRCDQLSFKHYLGSEFYTMGIAMLAQIPVFTLLLVIADVRKNGGKFAHVLNALNMRKHSGRTRVVSPTDSSNVTNVDEDVEAETIRVSEYFSGSQPNEKCVVAVKDLRKSYKCKKDQNRGTILKKSYNKQVLRGIDLLVEEGEVFGLLGHNGAGKTSAMKMIIAEETADSGKIQLCGHDIQSNLSDAFSKLGYCPQHDAVWENITLREHMALYAVIRGVQPNMRAKLVQHFLNGLQINEHADKKASDLSGGTKRKLSYCMSMLGAPKIVLLDEPSSGMDITSKRFLWNTVLGTFKDTRGAILTTHSMEEADALCTRIAIMVKGSLLCIGSPQHLKSKYGDGYTLEIKLKVNEENVPIEASFNVNQLVAIEDSDILQKFKFVSEHFPDSRLTEMFGNRAVYSLPNSSVRSVSQTFALLEQLKVEHNVEEYSFSQTTLEQVFLQFAKETDDAEINSNQ